MPEAIIYISFNPAYNSIRYWTRDAAERTRLEKETGTVATPFFATPALTGDQLRVVYNLVELARRVHLALDDSEEQQGPNGRQHALDGQHFDDVCEALERLEDLPDDKPGETMGPGGKAEWALRHALLPDGGIEAELQALRKKVATYEARDALGWLPPSALATIEKALRDYHYALDLRQHGGVAADQALNTIAQTMGMHWKQGEEAARRAATQQGGA